MLTRSGDVYRMSAAETAGEKMNKTLIAAVAMLVSGVAGAQNAPAGSAERGQKIFMNQMCYNCHGTIGQNGGVAGPKIAPNPFPWPAFSQQVRKPRADMPPYSEKNLPEQDLADIYAYLASIKGGPAAKDIPLLSGF
jgi:mono/diheme cytochrome c family protein